MDLVDLRQDPSYSKYMHSLGWVVDGEPGKYIYSRQFSILGSIAKIQRPNIRIRESELRNLVNKRKARVIYIEPVNLVQEKYYIEELGFRRVKGPSIPSKTVHIDLKKSQETLLSSMHHKTRYNIGLSKRRGVKVNRWESVEDFSKIWHRQRGSRLPFLTLHKNIVATHKSFGKRCTILKAEHGGEIVGAVLLVRTKTTGYYYYAAANELGKKQFAPTLLVWETILHLKKVGCEVFDFEGIYDARYPLKSWKGFSKFKKSFGGVEVEYPGPLRKLYLPFTNR